MAALGRAATIDDGLVWEHGRRLGIVGDGQSGDPSLLLLDGKPHLSNRTPAPFFVAVGSGLNGAGGIPVSSAVVGDTVVSVFNLTSPSDSSANFESTVTVARQVQQTSSANLTGNIFQFFIYPRS